MDVDDQTRALTYVDDDFEYGDVVSTRRNESGTLIMAYDEDGTTNDDGLHAVGATDLDVDLDEFVRGLAYMRSSTSSSDAGGATSRSERCMDVVRRQRRLIASMAARQKLFSASLQPSSVETK